MNALYLVLFTVVGLATMPAHAAGSCARERESLRICRTEKHKGSSCPKTTKKLKMCERQNRTSAKPAKKPAKKTPLPVATVAAPAEVAESTPKKSDSPLAAKVQIAPISPPEKPTTTNNQQSFHTVTDISDALEKFHNSLCDGKKSSKSLEGAWREFINGMEDPIAKALATRAMAVDITTRTALFEANPPGTPSLLKEHPKQIDCEEDIIALSIRNRRLHCTEGKYKCRYENDIFGAASNPKMYNVWSKGFLSNHDVTACFLNKEKIASGDKTFKRYSTAYKNLSERVQKILGYHIQNSQERDQGDYLKDIFKVESLDGNGIPNAKKTHYLTEALHYYHPNSLPTCDASVRNINAPVQVTIQQELPPGHPSFPISSGTVKLKGFAPGSNEPTYLLISHGKESKFDYKIDPQALDQMPKPSIGAGKDCLPQGLPPECNHLYYSPSEGRSVPVWQKDDAKKVKALNLERPVNENANGKYLKLSCSGSYYENDGKLPTFGGNCSEWMQVLTEVDQAPEENNLHSPDRAQ